MVGYRRARWLRNRQYNSSAGIVAHHVWWAEVHHRHRPIRFGFNAGRQLPRGYAGHGLLDLGGHVDRPTVQVGGGG